MHDYAEMRQGINDLMTEFDLIPDRRTTAAFDWSEAERRAAAERLGLVARERPTFSTGQSSWVRRHRTGERLLGDDTHRGQS